MDLEALSGAARTVTGTKQTAKAVANGRPACFVARDAEDRVVQPV